jgi:hypothetical protein
MNTKAAKEPEICPARVDVKATTKKEGRNRELLLDLRFAMAIDSKGETRRKSPTI